MKQRKTNDQEYGFEFQSILQSLSMVREHSVDKFPTYLSHSRLQIVISSSYQHYLSNNSNLFHLIVVRLSQLLAEYSYHRWYLFPNENAIDLFRIVIEFTNQVEQVQWLLYFVEQIQIVPLQAKTWIYKRFSHRNRYFRTVHSTIRCKYMINFHCSELFD